MERRDRFALVRVLMAWVFVLWLGGSVAAEAPRMDSLGDPLPPGAIARLGTMRLRHDRPVASVAFAPNGKTLASAGQHGIVRIWETATGRELHCCRVDPVNVNAIAYSPDGKLLACDGTSGVVFLDPATGVKLDRFRKRDENIVFRTFALVFAPDGKTIATGTSAAIEWLDAATGVCLHKLDGLPNYVQALSYSPDGKTLAYASGEEMGLCNPATGKNIRKLLNSAASSVVYSPDGKKLLISLEDNWRLLDAASGKELARADGPPLMPPAVFSPDGRTIAAMPHPGIQPDGPRLWDLSGRVIRKLSGGDRREYAQALAFSPDGKLLAAGGAEGRVRLWDIVAGKELDLPAGDALGVHRFALSRDGKTLAALDGAGRLRLWDTASGKRLRYWDTPEVAFVPYLALAPDASRLAVADRHDSGMPRLQVLDAASGRRRWRTGIVSEVRFATFSPDGSILAVSNAEDGIDLLDAASGQSRGRFAKNLGDIMAGLFSPDGKQFVTSSEDHTVRIWDVPSRRECLRLKGHGGGATVSHITFSMDSARLATGGDDGRVCLWDANTGRRLRRWGIDDERVTCLALSPDGKTVVANSAGNRFHLWDAETGTSGAAIEGHRAAVTFAAFLPDGRTLLTGSDDGTALLWDWAALRRPQQATPARSDCFGDPLPPSALARMGSIRWKEPGGIGVAACSPDGKIVATVSKEAPRLWDAVSGKEIRRLCKGSATVLNSLAFSPDGKWLAGRRDGEPDEIHLWDVASGASLGRAVRQPGAAFAFAFSPDGTKIAIGGEFKVHLWDLDSGEKVRVFAGPQNTIYKTAFSADGKTLLSWSQKHSAGGTGSPPVLGIEVFTWDVASGKKRWHYEIKGTYAEFSPDGQTLLLHGQDKHLHVCTAATGTERWHVPVEDTGHIFSPDGKLLLTTHRHQTCLLWDVSTGKIIRQSTRPIEQMFDLLYLSPDGTTLAAQDTIAVRFWDVATGRERRPFGGHAELVTCLDFAPDGQTLVSGSVDGTVRLWRSATGKELRVFRGSGERIGVVAFSPDGKMIASGDERNSIRLWEAATGKERGRFAAAPKEFDSYCRGIQSLSFSADGRILTAGSADGKVYLWDVIAQKGPTCLQTQADVVLLTTISEEGKVTALVAKKEDASNSLTVDCEILVWDLATKRRPRRISGWKGELPWSATFSPDGKVVAVNPSQIERSLAGRGGSQDIIFRETATGKEISRLDTKWIGGRLIFSLDGGALFADGVMWDVAAGKQIGEVGEPAEQIHRLVLSPDGWLLASTGEDCTILVRPAPRQARPPSLPIRRLSAREPQAWWTDLSAPEPVRAWRAVYAMIATPEKSVAFLRTVLRPHPPVDQHRIDRLLADLDSERFTVREQARSELGKLGELAENALRRTLTGKPSLEVRRQVLELLEQIEKGESGPESLRDSRVTAVLERIATLASVELLRQLAGGAAEAHLTREATASLQRLRRRAIKP